MLFNCYITTWECMNVSKAFCEIEEETLRRHSWLHGQWQPRSTRAISLQKILLMVLPWLCVCSNFVSFFYHNHHLTNVTEAWIMKKPTQSLNVCLICWLHSLLKELQGEFLNVTTSHFQCQKGICYETSKRLFKIINS